jgi:stearoyl-CoA desaturase (delta-9 desaturase)
VVCIAGFIHDVEEFLDVHPGGRHLLLKHVGQDATSAFFGGIYNHSSAAHNVSPRTFVTIVHPADWLQLLAMKRVGILRGGVPHISEEQLVPPSELLRIAHMNEFGTSNTVPY